MSDPLAVLASSTYFARLSPDDLSLLSSLAVWRDYSAGDVVVEPGDAPPGVFLVDQGTVRIYTTSSRGKEQVLHFARPGQTFLEVAVLGDFPAPARCEATTNTRLLLLPTAELRDVLLTRPQLGLRLMASMAQWIRHLVGLVEDLTLRNADERIARYLVRAPGSERGTVRLNSSHRVLASSLNLTAETLSRSLRRLSEQGLIDRASESRREIRLLDFAGLRALADETSTPAR